MKKFLVKIRITEDGEETERELEVKIQGHILYDNQYLEAAVKQYNITSNNVKLLGYRRIRKEGNYG